MATHGETKRGYDIYAKVSNVVHGENVMSSQTFGGASVRSRNGAPVSKGMRGQ